MLRKVNRKRRGAVFIMMAFGLVFLFVMFMAVIETAKLYTVTFNVETQLHRLANNAVELNIDDAWRRDGYNKLKTTEAKSTFCELFGDYIGAGNGNAPGGIRTVVNGAQVSGSRFASDGSYLYTVVITSLSADRDRATLECSGRIYIAPSIHPSYSSEEQFWKDFVFSVPIKLKSTNFEADS